MPPVLAAPHPTDNVAPEPGDNLIYALGQLTYDLPSRSRRASLRQRMTDGSDPEDPESMLAHLEQQPFEAASLHWALTLDGTPLYLIEPSGAFARDVYEQLRGFLREQLEDGVERISLAGVILGTAPHGSGIELPVVAPVLGGMYSWTTGALVSSLSEAAQGAPGSATSDLDGEVRSAVENFLDRVYHELRNLGNRPHERAINYAATNALQAQEIFQRAVADRAELDVIEVEPSPVSPPGSNCWDVRLVFFYPERSPQAPRRAYRFTVDVADVVPTTVGPTRTWSIR
jgi:cyanobactin maturation PatA/PatG family protease